MEQINTQPQPASTQPKPTVNKFPKSDRKKNIILVLSAFLVVALGVATGWFLSQKTTSTTSTSNTAPGVEKTENEAGIADESTFSDTAEGTLEEGGISGEGTHHLVRPGGDSQNVYLTSTVINLDNFVGKKVQVWGQTVSARKAGWLMDVGKVKVLQ